MSRASIRVWVDLPQATIAANLYGHFAEHLGRCIYEGIWVGPASRIPNENGLRLDVLAALKQLRAPVVRWPGGCFADDYHWRDGVGPRDTRPKTMNIWWQQTEPNEFGTDEFLRFCRAVGCDPYLCANVGSGTPQEARAWLEYCNFGGDTTLTALRAANGHPAPYGVRHWGVGNENWGCGGGFSPEQYAQEFARFSVYLRAVDPVIELVASGAGMDLANPILMRWNHDFCAAMPHAHLIDHLAMHAYFARGKGAEFHDAEHYALFGDLVTFEREIERADHVLGYFYPHKRVGLIIDEWGVWHPEATVDNGLEQPNTLRDALFAASCLNLFHRHARRIVMANIAQTINVLQCLAITEEDRMALTPTYHVYDMMRPHMGARLLTSEVETPTFEAHPVGLHAKQAVPLLNASASIAGKKVFLSVVNPSVDQPIETPIDLRGAGIAAVSGRVLTSASPRDANTIAAPKTVTPKRVKVEASGGGFTCVLPPCSLTTLTIALA